MVEIANGIKLYVVKLVQLIPCHVIHFSTLSVWHVVIKIHQNASPTRALPLTPLRELTMLLQTPAGLNININHINTSCIWEVSDISPHILLLAMRPPEFQPDLCLCLYMCINLSQLSI